MRAPIHPRHVHIKANPPHQVARHLREVLQHRQVRGAQHGHPLIGIARGPQRGPRRLQAPRARQHLQPRRIGQRRARREHACRHHRQRGVRADRRIHKGALLHRRQQGAAHRRIVEGRMEKIEPQHAQIAGRVDHADLDIPVAAQQGQQIRQRGFPPIRLIILQGRPRRGRVGHDLPLDPVEMHLLGACQEIRGLTARHIAGKFVINRHIARPEQILPEPERPRASGIGDLLERVSPRHPLGHDGAHIGRGFAQGPGQPGPGPLQPNANPPVIGRGDLLGQPIQPLPQYIALRPANDRGHAIAPAHRLIIVEFQPFAQRDRPGQPITADLMPRRHLRLHPVLRIQAIQQVINHEAVIAHHNRRAPNRVNAGQVGLRHKAQRPPRPLRKSRRRYASRQNTTTRNTHDLPIPQNTVAGVRNTLVTLRRQTLGCQ